MFRLLDVIVPGQPYRPRVIRPIIEKVDTLKELKVDSVKVPEQVTDTVTNGEAIIGGVSTGGDDNTMLLLSIAVVFVALLMCLYFVYLYRQRSYKLA